MAETRAVLDMSRAYYRGYNVGQRLLKNRGATVWGVLPLEAANVEKCEREHFCLLPRLSGRAHTPDPYAGTASNE